MRLFTLRVLESRPPLASAVLFSAAYFRALDSCWAWLFAFASSIIFIDRLSKPPARALFTILKCLWASAEMWLSPMRCWWLQALRASLRRRDARRHATLVFFRISFSAPSQFTLGAAFTATDVRATRLFDDTGWFSLLMALRDWLLDGPICLTHIAHYEMFDAKCL